ncbi:ABC transporter permease [Granulicoccus phenolivorans]|uniref:ABC transporter permease n=1 Tax=Granulicoccus phenolivorans TaxID=266854 RepID=UPI0004065FE6|nr:ABC transporter permease [Granulicoccus phenolivorans]
MSVEPSWQLAVALVLLTLVATAASVIAKLHLTKAIWIAVIRAALQLAVVSLIITAAVQVLWGSALFVALMFVVATWTTAKRCEIPIRKRGWVALAMACGITPVLLIIFGSGTMPLNGISLLPTAGIIIGNTMSGHTLMARRAFAELRANIGTYEAGLAIGLQRHEVIPEIIGRVRADAIVPQLDSTRTVGLVTLPGAFIGVLLGGGSPLQAGAAQLLVLVGILAANFVTVSVTAALIGRAKELPTDLAERLRP